MSLRRASTVCLVRDGAQGRLEVLMVQRPDTARFMPGVWVFPGGAVDDSDGRDGLEWRIAGLRELAEETGIWVTTDGVVSMPIVSDVHTAVASSGMRLDPDRLVYFSNWITPDPFPIRFDTRFFLAVDDTGVDAAYNEHELAAATWVAPIDALERQRSGRWDIAFPTRKVLELLATGASAQSLATQLRSLDLVPPIQPRLHVGEAEVRILLPDEPMFDEVAAEQSDPEILDRLARVIDAGGRFPAEFKRSS